MNAYRILGATGAALAALYAFLSALPADANIPSWLMIALGAGNAVVSAAIVYLASPVQIARTVVKKHLPALRKAQKEENR
jgi:Na+-translocating ferredoxin:NAD+ oxidoreductase RnfA subunit